ncbi:helix-turn-helix domain-containing protein [Canibacter sp. ZJ784]|uniref:helix-turn-helix domain-containing protein n=1 Tax=Canibacter zhoujuaniae TaxID=2708343 RepID=UPI0014215CA3
MRKINTEIKVELLRNNLTTEQLARKLGLSRTAISHKINGHSDFTVGEVRKLGEVFNIPAVVSATRLASELDMSVATLRKYLDLPVIRVGAKPRYRRSDVVAWLASKTIKTAKAMQTKM